MLQRWLLGGAVVFGLLLFGNSSNNERRTAAKPIVSFARIGDQNHLLVVSPGRDATTRQIRADLEQLAVNRSWFLFETSTTKMLQYPTLGEFEFVVLNGLVRGGLGDKQRLALDHFEHQGGRVLSVTAAGDLDQLL